jgi:hypothetical protein
MPPRRSRPDEAAADSLRHVLTGAHPLRLAGAAALLPDMTPARLLLLIDAARAQGRDDVALRPGQFAREPITRGPE